MLRPFDGGLHCGEVEIGSDGNYARVLPLFDGGLHCGNQIARMPLCPVGVLPPINGGLHCGRSAPDVPTVPVMVLPPFGGGLHYGNRYPDPEDVYGGVAPAVQLRAPFWPQRHEQVGLDLGECSRRSAVGSIAGRRSGRGCRRS